MINKDIRRAKRTAKFYSEGNILPLSDKLRKKISNREYYFRKKINLIVENNDFTHNYKYDLYNYHNQVGYNFKGSLTYRDDITMLKAHKDAVHIFATLKERGLIESYFLVPEYVIQHVHTHYVFKSNSNKQRLSQAIYLIFNRKNVGYNFLEEIESEIEKENALKYLTDKLNVNFRNRQSNIDYWYCD